MPAVHCHGDARDCGATTLATGQSTATVGGKAVAVQGDKNTHGEGALIASGSTVTIGGVPVIVVGDNSEPDNQGHSPSKASAGSGTVSIY